MPEFNQSRSRIIQIIFAVVFLVIVAQLLNLQLFSPEYRIQAEDNARYRKVIYPDRGIIYDRKKRAMLENTIMYDLVVTPSEIRGTDTFSLCNILGIDTAAFRRRINDARFKNSSVRPSVFEPLLSADMYARLYENMYKFPGFVLSERPVRTYPFGAGANMLGYINEIDTSFLRKHAGEGYEMGDYAGQTGMERSYEKVLMGQRGIKYYLRDNRSRIQGPYANGEFDTVAIAGKGLYTSIDIELQQFGEKLMSNKVGSIVAIDPQTGGILCMVSSPTYNPNYLTGPNRKKHYSELALDPKLPLLNRTIGTMYSPGSTFKTVVGIVGLTEGVIDDKERIACSGAFTGCGRPLRCLDVGVFDMRHAITVSDNKYFATVYKRLLDQARYGSPDSSLAVFNHYAYSFGLGNRLNLDLPFEKRGNMPVSAHYRKIFGKNWKSCNVISNSIGQGEIQTTLAQLANVMAMIANKGWFYTPHIVDSIEGGDVHHLLDSFKVKHYTREIPQSVFDIVQDGMQGVMETGTGRAAKVEGINICGKTGTVENYYRGVKQENHAFFGAFAPRENPRIAIAVMCENAGFGATTAAPIASLLIEKYLRDSIAGPKRKALAEHVENMVKIPKLMQRAIERLDSINRAKEKERLLKLEEEANRDTTHVEERIQEDDRIIPADNAAQPAAQGKKTNRSNDTRKGAPVQPASKPEERKYKRDTSKAKTN
jgi:penicillin-binding protein 2